MQEEACALKVPCVTVRESTERPETLKVGSNVIAGTDPERIVDCVERMLSVKAEWGNPFGDGTSSAQIIQLLDDT